MTLYIQIYPHPFILKSTFSVLDRDVIQNLNLSLPYLRYKMSDLILMFNNYYKEILKIYFIKVTKLSKIMIDSTPIERHKYLVYDCPNFVTSCKRNFTKRNDIIHISMYCTSISKI